MPLGHARDRGDIYELSLWRCLGLRARIDYESEQEIDEQKENYLA